MWLGMGMETISWGVGNVLKLDCENGGTTL